jgi:hypothetical protein
MSSELEVQPVTKRTYRIRVSRRMHLDLPLSHDYPEETWRLALWTRPSAALQGKRPGPHPPRQKARKDD